MLGDQVRVQAPGQQRPGVAVGTYEVGIRPSPVQGDLAEVADARGQLQPDQVEQGKVDQSHAMSISRVLARLLLVPLAGVLAGCAATLVAFFANWNVFLSVIGGGGWTFATGAFVCCAFAVIVSIKNSVNPIPRMRILPLPRYSNDK